MRAGVWPPHPFPGTFGLEVLVSLRLATDLLAAVHFRGVTGKIFNLFGLGSVVGLAWLWGRCPQRIYVGLTALGCGCGCCPGAVPQAGIYRAVGPLAGKERRPGTPPLALWIVVVKCPLLLLLTLRSE